VIAEQFRWQPACGPSGEVRTIIDPNDARSIAIAALRLPV
jgi:hypothetical protein